MALSSPQLQRFLATGINFSCYNDKTPNRSHFLTTAAAKTHCRYSAIAIDAPSSPSDVAGIRWGSTTLHGPRAEMEDALVIPSDDLDGFSFAAVLTAMPASLPSNSLGSDELYKECIAALDGGLLLKGDDLAALGQH